MERSINSIVAVLALGTSTSYGAVLLEPVPYISSEDSPFIQMGLDVVLEDFEDGELNILGLSASSGVVRTPSINTNSVDADDDAIDGLGRDGHSFLDTSGDDGVLFFFDETTIGSLPTAVGVVYTDGAFETTVTFEAFGPSGSLGTKSQSIPNTGNPVGRTDDDLFFGIIDPEGIIGFTIFTSDVNAMQIDHIQYVTGDIPEPTSFAVITSGLLLATASRRGSKRPAR